MNQAGYAQLAQLAEDGKSQSEIAAAMGLSKTTIQTHLRRLGVITQGKAGARPGPQNPFTYYPRVGGRIVKPGKIMPSDKAIEMANPFGQKV